MAKIVDEINKLQNDSIDLDLQSRLASVKKNMRGLDSSTEKYNTLVKEVLGLQIRRLENEKKKIKEATLQEKVSVQSKVTKLEKEINRQIVSFTKYKLDTKSNASLKNKTSVTLKDLENVFHSFINDVSKTIGGTADASINLSKKKLFRTAVNSKRDKQEAYHTGITGESTQATRKGIASVEVEAILESEKELADSLKEAFVDIKETIESTSSKREFDIQNEKFNLLVEVLEKNRGVIANNLEKELDKLIQAVTGEVKVKGGRLGALGGKYEDIKADADKLGVTRKLNAAGESLARGLGKIDGELGNFAESIISGIEGIDRFATGLFKIPETFNNFKKFLGGAFSTLSGKAVPGQNDQLAEVKASIDDLGKKFTGVINEKAENGKENPEIKTFGKRLKSTNKLTKVQAEQLTKTNKLTKISVGLMTWLNLEMGALAKKFQLQRVKGFFVGFGRLLSRYAGYILTGAMAIWAVGKSLVARGFIGGLAKFKSGIVAIGSILVTLARFTLPLLIGALTAVGTGLAALGLPVLLVVGGLGLMAAAVIMFPETVKKAMDFVGEIIDDFAKTVKQAIDYIKSLIPSWDDLNPFDEKFKSGLKRVGGWLDNINPFGASESEKQARQMANDVAEKSKAQPTTSYDGKNKILPTDETGTLMTGLISAETGAITDQKGPMDESRFIRTGAGADSSAYGPLQITKGLAKGSVNNGVFENDPELKKWVQEKFIPQGEKMLKADYNDKTYGKYGKGDLSGPEDRAMYEKMGKILVGETLKNNKGDVLKSTGEWRLGDKEKHKLGSVDPKYAEKVLTTVNNETKQLQTVMDQSKNLEYNNQKQMAAIQAKTLAQAMPNPSIINQNSNVNGGAAGKPNVPFDLRNLESTFMRSLLIDFGLVR